jgi:hypothetical protein
MLTLLIGSPVMELVTIPWILPVATGFSFSHDVIMHSAKAKAKPKANWILDFFIFLRCFV